MLTVYSTGWCPHCLQTEEFLEARGIPFTSVDIESQPDDVVQRVIDANGGVDWVVPTLEYNGQWRPGKMFSEKELIDDLSAMGISVPA